MARLSNATLIIMLRRRLRDFHKQVDTLTTQLEQSKERERVLETQLLEARRRSLPIGFKGEHGEINFLPLFVTSVDMKSEMIDCTRLNNDIQRYAVGRCRATIEVEGSTIIYSEIKKAGK